MTGAVPAKVGRTAGSNVAFFSSSLNNVWLNHNDEKVFKISDLYILEIS